MKINEPWKRLENGQFWREVDAEHNRLIVEQLNGCHEVLDLGCGYGSLTACLINAKFNAHGVDSEKHIIDQAKKIFPSLDPKHLQVMNAHELKFPDGKFDAVVLRDTMHHLWEEDDINIVFCEIERVLKPQGIIIIFDPNPNIILKICRLLARHQDAQCMIWEAKGLLTRRRWLIQHTFFSECFALAMSGGYVGVDFSTRWSTLHKVILKADRTVSRFLSEIGLGQALLWRYCIKAEKPNHLS